MKMKIIATVVSDVQDKTVVATVSDSKMHPIYKKRYKTSRKFHAHDEKNEAKVGDVVEIEETRPISKKKTWIVTKVVTKAQG